MNTADRPAGADPAAAPPAHAARLDAGPTACGELIALVAQQVRALEPGQDLEVVGYDPGAWEDIPAWCRMTGHRLLDRARGDDEPARFTIRKRDPRGG